MNKIQVLNKKQQLAVVVFATLLSLFVVWAAAFGASTISANISTDGTLSVTGVSTLTGGFLSKASSTVVGTLIVSGAPLQASSTLLVGGAATLDSTLSVTGLSTLTGAFISPASSTVSAQLNANTLGVSTSSPAQEVGITGDVFVGSTAATTSVIVDTTSTTIGGCIQLRGSNGTIYRLFISGTDSSTSTPGRAAGSRVAIWEPGTCK